MIRLRRWIEPLLIGCVMVVAWPFFLAMAALLVVVCLVELAVVAVRRPA